MRDLDERGLILSLSTFAEEALGDLIGAFLISGESTKQLLNGFNAPLGTFSARIKMAYSLGLITRPQREDLDRLRRIRNEFAHTWEPVTFTAPKIAVHISALNFSSLTEDFPDNAVEKVKTSISSLLLELRSTTHQIVKYGRRAKLIGQHLIAGVVGELDEQISICQKRLTELAEDLTSASGDRRRFLLTMRYSWEGKLEIVRLNAPEHRKKEIQELQKELKAWNIRPDNL
ncbi:MAG: transcriptional regulator [Candidatus Afipia apatlaquensis]|uniref:Transcriptional regulator n=1 Tax=Candidatus Afipia apatlaquensis TaxID=2712852 RepID=A0A7C9RC97_9BRAD|nr:transcriptional regulator [Candidatus Afipia apatlaquensis]